MDREERKMQQCYRLLRAVLQEAFHTQVMKMQYPYADVDKIDYGLRAMVWPDYQTDVSKMAVAELESNFRILVIRSNLGFYNILILADSIQKQYPDFIAVGPFRDTELSPDYFAGILKEVKLDLSILNSIRQIYERMPQVQLETILKVTQHILVSFFPEFEETEVEYMEYSEQKHTTLVDLHRVQEYSAEYAENYRKLLLQFTEKLKLGNVQQTRKYLEVFLNETKVLHTKNMYEYKVILNLLNSYCHMALLETDIHPVHTLKLAATMSSRIGNTTSRSRLEQLPGELCHKYCLLVKNYAYPDYSKMVREAIDYICQHMEEELSLHIIAEHFGRNASVLSHVFKKETGQNMTDWIKQSRIQEAIRLFQTTDLTVSEVSLLVGYQDFSYFSKIFSGQVGCSPREFRRKR